MSDAPQPEITSPPPPLPRATRAPEYDDDDDYRPRRRTRRPATRGVLPRAGVRMTCFVTLMLCLILAGAMCIMAVWDAAPAAVTWKAISTLGIVAAMTAGFTALNEAFGQPAGGDD